MSTDYFVVVTLLVSYCVVREIIFLTTVHRLINKLMSRNYQEFSYIENSSKNSNIGKAQDQGNDQDGFSEDLGALMGMG